MTTKSVQGVQGVQGAFLDTLHSAKPRGAWLAGGMCRVCRVNACVYVREPIFTPIKNNTALTYINTLHTLHTLHRPRMTRYTAVQGIFLRARKPYTPYTLKKIVRIMGKKIVCGPENIREFNAALRESAPAFYSLAKELHKAGLIDGLAGSSLQMLDDDDNVEQPAQQHPTTTHTCGHCHHFQADSIGMGDGIGACSVGGWPNRLKYPGREACRKFYGGLV